MRMKMLYKFFLSLLILTSSQFLSGQQNVQFTQYMYTPTILNPAFAGIKQEMNVAVINRSQWVGVNGAPVSQSLIFDTPINEKIGFALNILHDKIGPSQEINFTADVSYLIQLNDNNLRLSFGMKGGGHLLTVNFNEVLTNNPNDPALEDINSRFTPVIGTGVYVYTDQWYLGLSTPNFLTTRHFNKTLVSSVSTIAHYYLIGGMNFDVNDQFKLKPTFLLKAVSGAPISIDLSLNALVNKALTLGVSYRNKSSISALFDVKVNKNISIGYSYDHATNVLNNFSGGSHEILFRWNVSRIINDMTQPSWLY